MTEALDDREGEDELEEAREESVPLAEALRRVVDARPALLLSYALVDAWLVEAYARGLRRPETDEEDEAQARELRAALADHVASGAVRVYLDGERGYSLAPRPAGKRTEAP